MSAWRVIGQSGTVSRFDASTRSHQLTAFIGREEEVSLLKHRWALALEGEGQVLLLSAEPGIGNSRISRMLVDHATSAPHIILRA